MFNKVRSLILGRLRACGATALAHAAHEAGIRLSGREARALVRGTETGCSLRDLSRAAERLGIGNGVWRSRDRRLPAPPFIAHLGNDHFSFVRAANARSLMIDRHGRIDRERFLARWDGVFLGLKETGNGNRRRQPR